MSIAHFYSVTCYSYFFALMAAICCSFFLPFFYIPLHDVYSNVHRVPKLATPLQTS